MRSAIRLLYSTHVHPSLLRCGLLIAFCCISSSISLAQVPAGSAKSEMVVSVSAGWTGSDLEAADETEFTGTNGTPHTTSCQKTTDLEFGGAYSGLTTGTVVVDPNSIISRLATGGAILNTAIPGHPAVVRLTLTNSDHCENDDHCSSDDNECDRSEDDDNNSNDSRTSFTRHGIFNTITLPTSTTLSLTTGGHTYTMTADAYKMIRTNGTINIGATLHVGVNQVAGKYTGSFTVTSTCN